MAIIRKKEIKGMKEKELKERLKDLRTELLKINAQKSQAKSVRLRETKRTIARILTMLNQNKKQEKEKN